MKHNFPIEYFEKIFCHIHILKSILLLCGILSSAHVNSQDAIVFTFNLNSSSNTSAGIYKRDSTLVRTLWNNVTFTSGNHTGTWDRRDDDGRLLNDTGFVVKIISNNVKYTWEGVLGNTSDSFTGSTVIRMFDRMHTLVIAGGSAYYGAGYTEGITSSYKFYTNDIQKKYNIINSENNDMMQASEFVATDSINVYWAGYDGFDPDKQSFVYATKVSDDKEVVFVNGSPVNMTYGRTYSNAIDISKGNIKGIPKGLAVQKNGLYLFVSHPELNELHVLNKNTGELKQTITINSPRDLAIDRDEQLWMISDKHTVTKHSVDSTGIISAPLFGIIGLDNPLALAVSPDNTKLLVIDGGSSQQVKSYNNLTGAASWTFGQKGGYETDPSVTNDKFYFSDSVTMLSKPFIAFQPDASFWVGDVGNERVQHYDSSRIYIDRIMTLPHSYSVSVDNNDPTRVFNEYLEFKIDYSKPLEPNNSSWTLVRNWRHGTRLNTFQQGMFNIFNQVVTLSNGRTYATLENISNPNARFQEIVELPANGNMRYTGVRFDDFAMDLIESDGSLRRFVSKGKIGDSGYWETQALNGFINNNPEWGTPEKIARIPAITSNEPPVGFLSIPAMTGSNILLLFDRGKTNQGYHLGAIKKGDSTYIWKTSHATTVNYEGPFPTDGAYDIGNKVEYGGGNIHALEKNIFWNYHGEFWKNSQTNKWNHFYDNGLMIGQFGITTPEGEFYEKEAFAMGAGNVFSSKVVKVADDYYIYHNDESVHAGVHRWKISNLNTIYEQTIPLIYSPHGSGGLNGYYFDGADLNNVNLKTGFLHPVVNIKNPPSQVNNPSDYSARWIGFIKADYSRDYIFYTNINKGVRLWIDGKLIINKWGNINLNEYGSNTIQLQAGKIYPVKMEINGGSASLSWSFPGQSKQLIPSDHLYSLRISMDEEGIDLLEGLNSNQVLEDGLYGWNRNPIFEDSSGENQYWQLNSNIKTYNKEKPDLYMTFRRDNGQCQVSRELGNVSQCISSWKLNGEINFDGNYPNQDQNGGTYIEMIDENGKVIVRITNELVADNEKLFPTQIKCNGIAIFNEPAGKVSLLLGKSQPFEISVSKNGVVFKYSNFSSLQVPIFDTGCLWNRPKTLSLIFKGGSNNYKRAIDFSRLRFTSGYAPVITVEGSIFFCEGNSAILTSVKYNSYLWNTGALTQSIKVTLPGSYKVSTKDSNGCSATSEITTIKVNPLPKPVIQANNNKLTSNIEVGNQWYLKGIAIAGATDQNLTATVFGEYTLIVTDSNGCSGSATYSYNSGIDETKVNLLIGIFPNPGNGIIRLQNQPGISGFIRVFDMNGALTKEINTSENEIDLSDLASGIYTLELISLDKIYHFKLVIQ